MKVQHELIGLFEGHIKIENSNIPNYLTKHISLYFTLLFITQQKALSTGVWSH